MTSARFLRGGKPMTMKTLAAAHAAVQIAHTDRSRLSGAGCFSVTHSQKLNQSWMINRSATRDRVAAAMRSFVMIMRGQRLLAAAVILCIASPGVASAATLFDKFYNGTTGYTGDFSGAGTVYNDTKSLSTNCPTSGTCSADNLQTSQSYLGVTVGVTATANGGLDAWDDLTPNFGGLGN
jgi:hypothetical protein